MGKNICLIVGLDVLVIDGLARFRVNLADIQVTVENLAIKVLDEAYDPSHLDATFNGELAAGLHLPSCTRATPWSNFSKAGDNYDLVKIEEALRCERSPRVSGDSSLGDSNLKLARGVTGAGLRTASASRPLTVL